MRDFSRIFNIRTNEVLMSQGYEVAAERKLDECLIITLSTEVYCHNKLYYIQIYLHICAP